MKKILALVLAVAMLSSTAFAAAYVGNVPGKPNADNVTVNESSAVNPGSKIFLGGNTFVISNGISSLDSTDIGAGELNNANFAISKRTFKKGTNLVKSVSIDDDKEAICIELNQDLDLTKPNAVNLSIDQISVKAKKALDGVSHSVPRNSIWNYSFGRVNTFKVGYVVTEADLSSNPEYDLGTVTKFVKNGDTVYAIASQSAGDLYVEGRVYDGDKIFVDINTDVSKDALKAFPDADLRFVNLVTSGFTSNNTVNILAEETEFVYELKDKKVVKSNAKWNDDAYAWSTKTTGDKSYVISDVELDIDATEDEETDGAPSTENPETGANDVVGVAAALAVVSLVAAGAVSLKK